jgi:hypothetical protein
MELLWALAADAPAVVIEANFRPHSEYEREKLSALAAHPVEVYCTCPPELAVERYLSGPEPVYERAAVHGRMLPEGLEYTSPAPSLIPKRSDRLLEPIRHISLSIRNIRECW